MFNVKFIQIPLGATSPVVGLVLVRSKEQYGTKLFLAPLISSPLISSHLIPSLLFLSSLVSFRLYSLFSFFSRLSSRLSSLLFSSLVSFLVSSLISSLFISPHLSSSLLILFSSCHPTRCQFDVGHRWTLFIIVGHGWTAGLGVTHSLSACWGVADRCRLPPSDGLGESVGKVGAGYW